LNFLVIILGASVAGKAAKLIHLDEEAWLEFAVLIFATAPVPSRQPALRACLRTSGVTSVTSAFDAVDGSSTGTRVP
jgi:hypothetical protein